MSTLANVNRDAKRHPDPYRPNDFINWHESHREAAEDGALLVSDPEQQSRLIKQALFRSK